MQTLKVGNEVIRFSGTWSCIFFGDLEAINKLVESVRREGIRIVEVGSWEGFTASFIGLMVSGVKGKVFTIDHWQGEAGHGSAELALRRDVFKKFRQNMIKAGLWQTVVYPLVMDSMTAVDLFREDYLDLVFIDADHSYTCVKKDILGWLPKIRKGGVICGHDCWGKYTNYNLKGRREIDLHKEDGKTPFECHPGVIRALYDVFGDDYEIPNVDSTVWCKYV